MRSRGKFCHAAVGTAVSVICLGTSSEALCGSVYGDRSVGTSDPWNGVNNDPEHFRCSEGTFLRSIRFAAFLVKVVGIQYECSDGELSDFYGDDIIGYFTASCPDPEGFGIGRIRVAYSESFHKAEVYCAGDQLCQGYVCEDGENGTACNGEASYCGPIGWDSITPYNSSDSGCSDPDGSYLVGFRTVTLDSGGNADGVKYLTPICTSKTGCPLDRPDDPWDSGLRWARVIVGSFALVAFILAFAYVVYLRCLKPHEVKLDAERVTAAVVGAITSLGGGVAELLAGSSAAAVGFFVTFAFFSLFAVHWSPSCLPTGGTPGSQLFPSETPGSQLLPSEHSADSQPIEDTQGTQSPLGQQGADSL